METLGLVLEKKNGGGVERVDAMHGIHLYLTDVCEFRVSIICKVPGQPQLPWSDPSSKREREKKRISHIWFCFFLITSPEEEKLTKHSFLEKVLTITFEPRRDFT